MKILSKAILRGGFFFTADSPLSASKSQSNALETSNIVLNDNKL